MAVVVAIISIVISLIGGIMFGVIGGGIAISLGVLAMMVGLMKKKNKQAGNGGIIIGTIATIIGFIMVALMYGLAKDVEKRARDQGFDRLAECAPSLEFGMTSFSKEVERRGYNMDDIVEEFNKLE
ncbi:Predicted membrane protein [Eubacterium ruminantium]|nr:Predicted membrane protein [Eubacterium ruminantium]